MKRIRILLLVPVLVTTTITEVRAAEVEIGTSLISANVGVGEDNDLFTAGIPSGGFGVLQPALFVSLFVDPHIAIEPQFGVLWVSQSGESFHVLHGGVQVDYFVLGNTRRSPYLFASVGVIDVAEADENPTSVSGGAGYRFPVGDQLSFRVDGRFSHFTNDGGDTVSVALSIGGLFGR